MHTKTIYKTRELSKAATVKKFLTVQNEGYPQLYENIGQLKLELPDGKKFVIP